MIRFIATLTLVGAFCAACSSGGVPLDTYASGVEAGAAGYAHEIDDLRSRYLAELDDAVAGLQQSLEGAALVDAAVDETAGRSVALFASLGDALDRYIRDLENRDAPAVVSSEHEEFVDALISSRAGISPILEALPTATSFDEIDRVIAGSGFADAQLRVEAMCTTLERAIGRQGVVVDLRCAAMG